MKKILNIEQAVKKANVFRKKSKKIVLTGGCFDILHVGHIILLENAKRRGDVLFVFLESDSTIKSIKGEGRPINTQDDRAKILASLQAVDYVINLPHFSSNDEYDSLVRRIKPAIIATTRGDPRRAHKERQAKLIGGQVVDVTKPLSNKSTTRLISILKEI